MTTTVHVNKSLQKVMQYQNESVVKRIAKDRGCDYIEAFEIFEDTKRFLYLCGAHNGGFAPSKNIDDGWHAFILHTWDYQEFCMKFFGKFIHHFPNSDNSDRTHGLELINRTREIAHAEFGKLSGHWNYNVASVYQITEGNVIDCSDRPCNDCSSPSNCQSN